MVLAVWEAMSLEKTEAWGPQGRQRKLGTLEECPALGQEGARVFLQSGLGGDHEAGGCQRQLREPDVGMYGDS